ncbi:hypothetical protein SAMN05421833_1657 [Microbispora rosea]|uniref:Uncharacterized protein n=1 Tax=Microbispora rosea TaxID=58117 RepID=A0A1N7HKQ7_9ACTN|nr:hypothetical protein [Microbispora rosea]GIH53058.1 hypothetical protein Mro03_82370 [Microbispora rosea subsp. rosea]SIS25278.1 hypothetical protein SAMN05421833_1657 [Microbispora rosea]
MGDKRTGRTRVVAVSARRLAVAALLIVMPSAVAVPRALAAQVSVAGHVPQGQGKKSEGKKNGGKKGKKDKGKKGKGHGHGGARIDARLAGFGGGGFGGGFGHGGGGGGTQRTSGMNTANAPTISSPPYQLNTGKRNVNAPAGNSAVDFAGVQQVSSVSVFTDSLSGNCRGGIENCSINQTLESTESRGAGIGR